MDDPNSMATPIIKRGHCGKRKTNIEAKHKSQQKKPKTELSISRHKANCHPGNSFS